MNTQAQAVLIKTLDPIQLVVVGSIMTPKANDRVSIRKAKAPGINPTYLYLELAIIDKGIGPMKMTQKFFRHVTLAPDVRIERVWLNLPDGSHLILDPVTISK